MHETSELPSGSGPETRQAAAGGAVRDVLKSVRSFGHTSLLVMHYRAPFFPSLSNVLMVDDLEMIAWKGSKSRITPIFFFF